MSIRATTVLICAAAIALAFLPASPAEAGDCVTFRGTGYSTSSSFTPGVFPVIGVGHTDADWLATHLGRSTATSSVTLIWTPAGVWFEGPTVLTAANGDQLHFNGSGWQDENLQAEGTWLVTGGTGRFAGATGSGTVTGYWTDDGTQVTHATGTICYKRNGMDD